MTEDTEFTASDVKAILTALNYILHNAARNNVDADTLSHELQQLGLPKESANALKRAFSKNREELRKSLSKQILTLPTIGKTDWSVDYILSSSIVGKVNQPLIRMQITIDDPFNMNNLNSNDNRVDVNMSQNQLQSLLHGTYIIYGV